MIVDTSALVAVLRGEPEADRVVDLLLGAEGAQIAAPTLVELYAVADGRDPAQRRRVDDLLSTLRISAAPFSAEHAAIAREAYRDYGRGSGHPARLNLGDCFSYALARASGEPLLYVGGDFGHTDVEPALGPD